MNSNVTQISNSVIIVSNMALSSLEEQADYFESSSDAVNGSI